MIDIKYLWYVLRHKWFVFVECCQLGIPWLGIVHDWSKFTPSEWSGYKHNFFGGWSKDERPEWVKDGFDLAWNHHLHANKHHWNYWVLDGKALKMPDRYRKEMLADWHGAGRAISGKKDTLSWYSKSREKIILHPDTHQWIEDQLELS